MGYEVIDEHGTVVGADRRPSTAPASEPYDLGAGEPGTSTPPPPRDAAAPAAPRPSRPGTPLERLLRRPAAVASCGLLVGALLGGYVVHQHGVGEQRAQARSDVSAVAVAENQQTTDVDGVRTAALTVRLTNVGSQPVEPVLSPPDHRATREDPLVEASTSHPTAAAGGGSTVVTVSVPLPCHSRLGTLRIPVRSADSSRHEVEVTSVASRSLEQDRTMCVRTHHEQTLVEAGLAGTVDDPYIVVRNRSARPRRIWLAHRADSPSDASGVRVRLVPALPHDVDGNSTLRITLVVTADHCVRDVAALEQAPVWIALHDSDTDRATPPTADYPGVLGFGIGSVVTYAMTQACR